MTLLADQLIQVLVLNPAYLVSALVLLGFAFLFFLQLRHHRRMERFAGEVRSIRDLREELNTIKQILKQADLQYPLHLLEDLRDTMGKLEQALAVPVTHRVHEEEEEEIIDILGALEKHLRPQGFRRIHLLTELPDLIENPSMEFKIPLEAVRDGVSFKGYVVFKEGQIVTERLKPAYEAFP
ncbi:MAG: hypothetical protein ACYTG7_21840 [Planctomycetota bacterium]|jgi:hypothetical protein